MTAITQPRGGIGLGRYADVLRTPGALGFAIPGVIGRMPMGMLSIAQVMLVVSVTGRYGTAGAVSATSAVAYAIATPRIARLADRFGQAGVLRPLAAVFAVATAAFAVCAVGRAPTWALIVTGGLSRASMPSLGPMVRARWSQLLAGTSGLDSAFSLEGVADELIFVAGPALAVTLVTEVQPVSGVLAAVVLSVAGVAGLTRQRRSQPDVLPTSRGRSVLRSGGLRALIGMHVCLGALFAAVDLATVAFAAEHGAGAMAGPLLALYGLGSAIAGLWYGARRWRAPHSSRLRAGLAATALGVGPLAFMPGLAAMAVAIFVAGLGISATLISSYTIAERVVDAGQRTEGMSWLTTAAATGTAIGASMAGRLVDAHGAGAGYLFGLACGLAGLVILTCMIRHLGAGRDESGRSAGQADRLVARARTVRSEPEVRKLLMRRNALVRRAADEEVLQLRVRVGPPAARDDIRRDHHDRDGAVLSGVAVGVGAEVDHRRADGRTYRLTPRRPGQVPRGDRVGRADHADDGRPHLRGAAAVRQLHRGRRFLRRPGRAARAQHQRRGQQRGDDGAP
ncbi:MAG TPA: MFS transporter [Streptosporangiaceae bacterium]|nr:MFS transporter [Streptosporangiaceae bacterium]